MRLRKFVSYRKLEKPYTRYSKYKKLSYVRARPVCKVVRFDMGDSHPKYDHVFHVIATTSLQIRDNALESARQTCNRVLEKVLGKTGYHLLVRAYPHHILRENPLAAGAGADRLSTGMAHSFGKPMGIAAQIKKGNPIFTLKINKENLQLGKDALKRTIYKIPCHCNIVEEKIK